MNVAIAGVMIVLLAALPAPVRAQDAQTCDRAQFEAAVDEAAAALRDLNSKHRPAFQEKLRMLKEKRGWTHDQFMKEAAPLVKDEQTDNYDQSTNDALAAITLHGQEGAGAPKPDCSLLVVLRSLMTGLVQAQTGKWEYLFAKLEAELKK